MSRKYEFVEIREALSQALRETLARIVAGENLDSLLALPSRDILLEPALARVSLPALREVKEPCPLTSRELEILTRIGAGDSNKEIARAFGLSVHTVKRHVANILTKLGVSSRLQAATWLHARH